ncbi:MAG: electron transport complex subunit E [Candidatus Omnitrophota bacterium]
MRKLFFEFIKGIIQENPVFVLVLGLCPTLAISTSVINSIGMGIAATFVLVGSNVIIASLRNLIPDKVRIPCYIVVIATFVTIVELSLKAYSPVLDRALGIYVPLIVVNCIIMARAEAYAAKQPVLNSLLDGLGMGIGFTISIIFIAAIREFLGSGTFLGMPVIKGFEPAIFFVLSPGALLVMGCLLGMFNYIKARGKN